MILLEKNQRLYEAATRWMLESHRLAREKETRTQQPAIDDDDDLSF